MALVILTTSDTLTSLATDHYGDAGQWYTIAQANDLRPPYISDDPLVQYGPVLVTLTLAQPAVAGQAVVQLDATSTLLRPGVQLVITYHRTDGTHVIEAITLASVISKTAALATPLARSHPVGARVQIHPGPLEVPGRVARPGDTLLIPDSTTAANASLEDRYGRDLAIDPDAGLLLTDDGDLATVGGAQNLAQQMRHRLTVSPGTLLRHPTYGNGAQAYVGRESSAAVLALMQSQLAVSAIDDPRIVAVENVVLSVSGTAIHANLRLIATTDAIDLSIRL